MHYILMDYEGSQIYQETYQGNVQRYVTLDGTDIGAMLPAGTSATVVDTNPQQPAWALPDPAYVPPTPAQRMCTKNQFIDRLGDVAYVSILAMARQSVQVEAFVKRLEMATPDADGNSVNLDDPRTQGGVRALEAALIAQGVVVAGWADEVLNA